MDWSVLAQNAGALAQGLLVTLEVSALALVLALALGVVVAVARVAPSAALRGAAATYVEVLRNIPLLVQLFFLFFALPTLPLVPIRLDAFTCGVIALGVYSSAFVAEAIRSGIAAVARGQLEAALASGMTYATAMRLIVLPQAFAKTIPPLGNTVLNLIKNSSLVSTVSVLDLLGTANQIGARTFAYLPMFAGAAIGYLILTLPTAYGVNVLERRSAR
jgi:putative glutamine transport system permease protein